MARTLRRFAEEDAPALWEVYFSAIRLTAARDYSPEQIEAWAPVGFSPGKWAARMRGIAPFVVEQDGVVAGYADVQRSGYIDHFFVAADFNRQGVGSVLMGAIHAVASEQRIASLFADVSITARPFFEDWGFVVEHERTLELRTATLTNFRMRKQLP